MASLGYYVAYLPVRLTKYFIRIIKAIYLAVRDVFAKGLDNRSAALSFFTLISILPLLIVITVTFSLLPFEADMVIETIYAFFPDLAIDLSATMSLLSQQRQLYGIVGFILAYYFATGLFRVLHMTLLYIFEQPLPPFSKNIQIQLLSVPIFILGLFAIYVAGYLVSSVIGVLLTFPIFENMKTVFILSLFVNIANLVNFLTFFSLVFLIYHVMSPRPNKLLRNSLVLTTIIAVLFTILKTFFGRYLNVAAAINPVYGTFGGVLGLLLWIFISFNIILIGARALYYLEFSCDVIPPPEPKERPSRRLKENSTPELAEKTPRKAKRNPVATKESVPAA